MAGKYGSASVWFLVNGYNLITSKLKSLSVKASSVSEDTTGLGDTWREFTPAGLSEVTLTATGGYFDTTATTGAHAALAAPDDGPQDATRVVCLGFAGQASGAEFVGCQGTFEAAYDVQATVGELTKATADWRVTGRLERGQILQPLAAQTVDWNTDTLNQEVDYTTNPAQVVVPITANSQANPTVVTTPVPHGLTSGDIVYISGVSGSSPTINGERTVIVLSTLTFSVPVDTSAGSGGTGGSFVRSNTTGGAAGYLQVTDCSGFTNFVAKIRDSADNSTYADLITFADNVSDPFAERVTVAGTVDRYLTVDGNVTGAGSVTCFIGLASCKC